ncbi:hypothetical protein [Variovorax paradoxus]|uniref:hypothetical protein n=1 Tax=Variovorax paradoxus TaxID=34073 RepID=UPI002782A068|nr:hypothetical protein [Variovorax paradoxus]MDP9928421.1 hypothetical protein [Variovorax paradoxus]
MGAPIWIGENKDLWITNGLKDAFCEVLTTVATLEGRNIMTIYEEAAGVAGTYGVSGLGIDLDEFHSYLGGPEGVRRHLDVCRARLSEVAESCGLTPIGAKNVAHVLAWAAHIMDGHSIPEGSNFYEDWPPGMES